MDTIKSNLRWTGLSSFPLYYALPSFSAALLHNLFILYYFDVFFSVLKLEQFYFFWGQILFMIWNAINDPFFGFLIDREIYNQDMNRFQSARFKIKIIQYAGFCWSASFLFLFSSIFLGEVSQLTLFLYFVVSLCFYDAFLSLTLLAHGSLLADLEVKSEERAKTNMYSSVAGSIGSNSIFFAHFFWSPSRDPSATSAIPLTPFYKYIVFIFFLSLIGFYLLHRCETALAGTAKEKGSSDESLEPHSLKEKPELRFLDFFRQLRHQPNFWIFVVFNLIQVFNCHFNSNFLILFLTFMGESSALQSIALSLCALLPHLFVVLLQPKVQTIGLYRIILYLLFIKILVSLFGIALSPVLESSFYFAIFLIVVANKAFNETICRHGNLILSDLVDEDYVQHKRPLPRSSIIWGANALFSKPGSSLAPITGSLIFTQDANGTLLSDPFNYFLLLVIPLACGLIQIVLWKKYDLKAEKLKKIKATRLSREQMEKFV